MYIDSTTLEDCSIIIALFSCSNCTRGFSKKFSDIKKYYIVFTHKKHLVNTIWTGNK